MAMIISQVSSLKVLPDEQLKLVETGPHAQNNWSDLTTDSQAMNCTFFFLQMIDASSWVAEEN